MTWKTPSVSFLFQLLESLFEADDQSSEDPIELRWKEIIPIAAILLIIIGVIAMTCGTLR